MKIRPESTADFYKVGHHSMEPAGLQTVFNNMTPRSNKLAPPGVDEIVWFGLNYYIKDFLIDKWNREFFHVSKEKAIMRYSRRMDTSLGEGAVSTTALEELHDLGYLPIIIYALPEGSRVPMRVAPMVTYNTEDKFAWVVNYLESVQSCYLWMPSTNATIADQFYSLLEEYAELTGGDKSFVQFQGHDFSFRGMSSLQSAVVSGMAHLTSFVGTDTIPAIDALEDYYGANAETELVGCSVPASEHSIACLNIANNERLNAVNKRDGELQFLSHYLDIFPKGIASYVSDTYDYWGLITDVIPTLKEKILAREGKLVVRPDSGDPVRIVAGYRENEISRLESINTIVCRETGKELTEYEVKGSIQCLWDTFGGTQTDKFYKLLDSHIGLIYGDSISLSRAKEILQRLSDKGFASTNIVFGIGSYTYQYNTRDTFGWAVKATYGAIDGEPLEIYKDPKTGDGVKKSAKGLVAVYEDNGSYIQKDGVEWEDVHSCAYELQFVDGQQENAPTLSGIRKRIRNN